ncbi:MAG: DUF748 domain-containing protein [Proteobacteria bacterium]|nr:DUF748 domain-containing protein [Burkholderiales bacterium]
MRRPSLRKLALGFAAGLGLFALVGFLIVPPVARSMLVNTLGQMTGREVSIEKVAFNPFLLSASIAGLTVHERGSKAVFVSVAQLEVDLDSSSLWNLAPVVSALQIVAPRVNIVRLDDTRFNFDDVLDTLAKRPQSDAKSYFSVNNIELVGGRIDVDDRFEATRHALTDIQLGVPFVSNLPTKVHIKVTPAFAANFNDTRIELKGETVPFQDTLESSLQLSLVDLQLEPYLRYIPGTLGFAMQSGRVSSDLRIFFIRAKGQKQRLTLSGVIRLRDLALLDADKAPLVSAPLVDLDIESLDVFGRSVELSKVTMNGLALDASRDADGRINLLALLPQPERARADRPPAAAPAPPAPIPADAVTPTPNAAAPGDLQVLKPTAPAQPPSTWRFSLGELVLLDGRAIWSDRLPAQAFRAELVDIDLDVKGLSNAEGSVAQFSGALRTAQGETLTTDAAIVLAPFAAEGRIELSGLQVRSFASYYAPLIRIEIDDAKVDASAAFKVVANADTYDTVLTGLALSVTELRARGADSKDPLVSAKTVALNGVDLDFVKRTATIAEAIARDGMLRVERAKNSQFVIATLFSSPPVRAATQTPAATASDASPPPPPAGSAATALPDAWSWTLKRAEVDRFAVRILDRVPAEPVEIDLTNLAAAIDGLSSAKGALAKATLKLGVNRGGSLAMSGQFSIDPPNAAFEVDAQAIDMLALRAYLPPELNVVFTSGDLSAKGTLNVDASTPTLRAAFLGDAGLMNFAATARAGTDELLRWKALSFRGVSVTSAPMQLAIGEVALSDFFARLVLSAQGRLNLQDLIGEEATAKAASSSAQTTGGDAGPTAGGAAAESAASAANKPGDANVRSAARPAAGPLFPFPVKIGRIVLSSGNVNFSDLFVRPNYKVNVTGVSGSISSLSSDPGSAAEIDLRGRLDGIAPVEVIGRVNPITDPLFLDIKAAVRGAELATLTPYSTRYTGYGIENGRLTLNVAYRIDGRKLTAEHRIFLDQLTFSTERIEGPAVLKLPILFAVRLLQNRRGEIDLNIPISGTLDDPQFRLGPIIGQVIVNLITRAVTAPFSLLASLAGGGGSTDASSFVEFAPGRATLTDAAQKRLAALGKALADRPTLRLDLAGGVDASLDREALRRAQLDTLVRAQQARDAARKADETTQPGDTALGAKDYETYLRAAYRDAKFQRPRTAIGLLRELPVSEMETLMLANIEISDDMLRALALARARAVEAFLVNQTDVSPERVFLVPVRALDAGGMNAASAARVDLGLR